jgi:putative acetyltransferase
MLMDTLIEMAREIGYERMRLDTLPSMTRAMEIYRSLGFREIAAYRANPVPGASFLELDLSTRVASE